MAILYIITEGLIATMLMTVFVKYAGSVNVTRILGTMLLNKTRPGRQPDWSVKTITVGTAAHYFVGILFAFAYNIIKMKFTGVAGPLFSMIFGVVAGAFAIIIWKLFIRMHPNPPLLPSRFFVFIFAGHLVFGEGMWLTAMILAAI
jgi:energy-converting hydrogenase Eha subunit A